MDQGVIEEITIEEFVEDIQIGNYDLGSEYLKITEIFKKRGKCVYIVRDLTIELEQDFICSSDYDNIIQENRYTLMMFLKNCITTVHRVLENGVLYNKIYLDDGVIIVEYLFY